MSRNKPKHNYPFPLKINPLVCLAHGCDWPVRRAERFCTAHKKLALNNQGSRRTKKLRMSTLENPREQLVYAGEATVWSALNPSLAVKMARAKGMDWKNLRLLIKFKRAQLKRECLLPRPADTSFNSGRTLSTFVTRLSCGKCGEIPVQDSANFCAKCGSVLTAKDGGDFKPAVPSR